MTPERWARLKELFIAASEAGEAERRRLLDDLAREDPELAGELESLLAADRGEAPETAAETTDTDPGWLRGWRTRGAGSPSGERNPAPPPARIDRYNVLGELGQGGMGRVFLAERADGAYRQRVALKALSRGCLASEEARRRFLAERQILARLAHPAIGQLIDGGTTADGEPFLVTEFVDGRPIDVACREDGLGGAAIVRLFLGVCEAVEAAHRSLVVHRDLKPGNILVTADRKPKLLDFGIAKLLDPALGDDAAVVETRLGHAPLTPRYASPEQVRGEPVAVATDVYSLGVVLYELLSGVSPYGEATGSAASLARAICELEPRPPSNAARTVADVARSARSRSPLAGDLDAIVLKALRKAPAERYGSVAELAEDLRRSLDGLPVAARRGSRLYRFGKFARRNRWPLATAAAAAVLLVAFGIERERQLRAIEHERDKAREVAAFIVEVFSVAEPSEERGERMPVREVLDAGAARLERELAEQPEIRASLLETIGRIDHRLGRVRAARPLLDRAVELRRGFGNPVELARALFYRGESAELGGDSEQAARDYREGLAQLAKGEAEPSLAADLRSSLGRLEPGARTPGDGKASASDS
ncbi:MAG TPA: serine/threonine-protein kinase [Thermoanaerobaculia bacterium]|nr:serine/threonine-protein kinase [Thermoanaerobaculia bacterium]